MEELKTKIEELEKKIIELESWKESHSTQQVKYPLDNPSAKTIAQALQQLGYVIT